MASRSLRNRLGESTNIWPGFVDVLATLLIVIIFVLMVFTVSQIYLSDAISGRDKALENLRNQINELSKINSILATAVGWRALEPLKMTSVRFSPRNCLAELSPITQRTASIILDLPQPFGPTTAHRFPGSVTVVGSTNDLNPASFICLSRMEINNHPMLASLILPDCTAMVIPNNTIYR